MPREQSTPVFDQPGGTMKNFSLTLEDHCIAPNRRLRHKSHRLRWPRPRKTMNALALLLTLTLLGTMTPTLLAAARDADWKKVEEAIGKGLPKTAIEALEPIIAGALADQA